MTVQMALWALSYPVIKLVTAPDALDGFSLTVVRTVLAAAILSPLWIVFAIRKQLPPRADLLRILGWGAWYFGGALVCFNASVAIGRPELSGILFSGFPIILALLAAAVGLEAWHPEALPFVLVSLLGAVIVVTRGDLRALGVVANDLPATGLMLVSMLMVAAYAIGAKRLLATYQPLLFVTLSLTGGALALLLISACIADPVWSRLPHLDHPTRNALIYLILMNTIATEWMSMYGLRRLSVVVIGVFNYLQPPLVVLFSLLLPGNHEGIGWPLAVGGALILYGAGIVGRLKSTELTPQNPDCPC